MKNGLTIKKLDDGSYQLTFPWLGGYIQKTYHGLTKRKAISEFMDHLYSKQMQGRK